MQGLRINRYIQIAQSQSYSSSELALKLLHSKSYARLQTKKGAHQPLIIVRTIPDQVTSAVHAWLAVRRPHATTPGDDGLSMASGGTRQVPTTAMTGGMISDMLRHATSPAADGGCV